MQVQHSPLYKLLQINYMGTLRKLELVYEVRPDNKKMRDCYDIVERVPLADHVLIIPKEKNRLIVTKLDDDNPALKKRPKEMFFQNKEIVESIRAFESGNRLIKLNSLLLNYHATYACKEQKSPSPEASVL